MPETLFDAISAGIESASPAPASSEPSNDTTNTDGTSATDLENGTEAASDESVDGAVADPAVGVEGDTEADESAGDEGTDADADSEQNAADEEPVSDVAGKKKDGAVDGKSPASVVKDPVNDPIPNALKKETKERIQSLISTVKTTLSERDIALQQRDELVSAITETKSTPQQYGQALDYLRLVNSGDPVLQKQALKIMQDEVAALARIIGEPVPGVDMLAGHPDLQQQVRDNILLQEHAEEIAAARESKKVQVEASTRRTQTTQAEQAQQQAVASAREELNQIGATLAKDPDFARKRDILVPALKPVFETTHPSKWAGMWKAAYDKLVLPKASKPTTVPTNQPLRAKNPSGGAKSAPSSLLEAISDGIASASR